MTAACLCHGRASNCSFKAPQLPAVSGGRAEHAHPAGGFGLRQRRQRWLQRHIDLVEAQQPGGPLSYPGKELAAGNCERQHQALVGPAVGQNSEANGARVANADPGNLIQHMNQVGKVFRFQVTGGVPKSLPAFEPVERCEMGVVPRSPGNEFPGSVGPSMP